ncbi:Uncharacterised protein [Bordetella pertussis]|nr:Uncharacterised protein [Bordetella pertussis]
MSGQRRRRRRMKSTPSQLCAGMKKSMTAASQGWRLSWWASATALVSVSATSKSPCSPRYALRPTATAGWSSRMATRRRRLGRDSSM